MTSLYKGIFGRKTEIKFLQGWLNTFEGEELSVDGSYGNKTVDAVKRYQKKYNLSVDGKAGPMTLNHMGFITTKNQKIVILKIPFNRITEARVLLKNGEPYSCKKFADEGKFDIVWNGAFFNTKDRKVVQFIMQDGNVQSWGFGYEGIVYPNEFDKAFGDSYHKYANKEYDMQGSAPTLIHNYVKDIESIKAFNQSIYNSRTRRNCTAVTDDALMLFFTVSDCTLEEMTQEGLYQKVSFMQGNDGGGSQSIYMSGSWVITTDGRAIPAGVGLKVR